MIHLKIALSTRIPTLIFIYRHVQNIGIWVGMRREKKETELWNHNKSMIEYETVSVEDAFEFLRKHKLRIDFEQFFALTAYDKDKRS